MENYGTYQILFWITTMILFGGYVAISLWHSRSILPGTVVRVKSDDLMAAMMACEMDVQLDNGDIVHAKAAGCVLCKKSVEEGTRVALVRQTDGWLVSEIGKQGHCPR